ncbi:AAA family ATPase [Ammoniphilus sp. YIM 78166]|uniref:ATP-binding protein n=1 Tax=Ammoniphilus sp. YIM 78166 TaxID=1644106 RepID=UPI00106FC51B|nr:AAA family ATPase [Ammoniphilus sp. YIM 78166]
MIITSVHIYGFGKYQDYSAAFGPGLNLVDGHNEAGKSTLLAFLRAMLFGFDSRRNPELRYEPFGGGKFGGMLTLLDSNGQEIRIERLGHKKSQGIVRVFLPNGEEKGEEWLARLLGGISPQFYAQVYSFGLTELSHLNSLNQEDVAHFLYNSGTGVSLQQWERNWVEETEKLFKPKGTQPIINQLLNQLEAIDRQLRDGQQENEAYNRLLDMREDLELRISYLQEEMGSLQQQVKKWERVKELYPLQQELKAKESQLRAFPENLTFPEQGLARLQQMEQELFRLEAEIEDLKEAMNEQTGRMNHLFVDEALIHHGDEIMMLWRQAPRFQEKKEQLDALRGERDLLARTIDRYLTQLGDDWNREKLASFDGSIRRREWIREQRQLLQDLASNQKSIHQMKIQKEEEASELRHQCELARAKAPTATLPPLEQLEQEFLKLQAIHIALQNDYEQRARINQGRNAAKKNKNTSVTAKGLILLLGLAISGVWAVMFEPSWFFVPALAAVFLVIWLSTKKGEKESQQSLGELDARISEKEQQVATIADQSFKGEKSLDAISLYIRQMRMKHEEHLRYLEKIRFKEEQLTFITRDIQKIHQKAQEVTFLYEREWEEWNKQLVDFELPLGLSPEGVLEVLHITEKAKEVLLQFQERVETYEALELEIHRFTEAVERICHALQIDSNPDQPWAPIQLLYGKLLESYERVKERKSLENKVQEHLQDLRKKEGLRRKWQDELQRLLQLAHAEEVEEFRKLAILFEERRKCEEEARQLTQALHASANEELIHLLSTCEKEEAELKFDNGLADLEKRQQELQQLIDERGQCKQKIKRIETGTSLTALHQEKQEILTELEEASKQWTTSRMALLIVKKIKEAYELERQPGVLQRATAYFKQMTNGRYQRVFSPLGEPKLMVETNNGMRLDPSFLSRGTREQLFLCLRFALIEECAGPEMLPIILDDIFVNFDQGRTDQAIERLADVSQKQQTFLFSCHEHVVERVKQRIPHHRYLSLSKMELSR